MIKNKEVCERFSLHDGQFFAYFRYKNLQWFVNGEYIGFGDLTIEQIAHIKTCLRQGEVFEGFNEHHGTEWQQRDTPMITINPEEG